MNHGVVAAKKQSLGSYAVRTFALTMRPCSLLLSECNKRLTLHVARALQTDCLQTISLILLFAN